MTKRKVTFLSVFLCLTVLLSSLSVVINAKADTPYEITISSGYNSTAKNLYESLETQYGENILKGKTVYARQSVYTDTMVAKTGDNWPNITDGKPANSDGVLHLPTTHDNSGTLMDAGRYWYFDLAAMTELEQITLFNDLSAGKDLELCDFEIYVSKDVTSLWDAASKVVDYSIDSMTANLQDFKNIQITFIEKPQGRYIGFYWPHPCNFRTKNGTDKTSTVRLTEISVFGNEPKSEENEEKTGHIELLDSLANGLISFETGLNDLTYGKMVADSASGSTYTGGINQTTYDAYKSFMGANMLANATLKVQTASGNNVTYIDGNYPFRATDGVIDSASCYQMSVLDANGNRVGLDSSPITITYDMGKTVMAENIMIGSSRGSNQLVAYELYISDSEQNLYNAENKFASYDVSSSIAVNRWGTHIEDTKSWANKPSTEATPNIAQIFIPENAIGRYFGIKVIRQSSAVNDNVDQIAIGELAFFARPFIVKESNDTSSNAKKNYDGKNLLKPAEAEVDGLSINAKLLADGDYGTLVLGDSSEGTISFALDDVYLIDGFATISAAGNARIGDYEIYASLDKDELFLEENKRAYHTALASASPAVDGCTIDDFGFNAPFKAKYVGIKVKDASLDSRNEVLQLYELVATGSELPSYTVDTQVMLKKDATNYLKDNLGVNRLLKAQIESKNVNAGFPNQQVHLIDGDLAEINFAGNNGDPTITFKMRNEILVSDFAVLSAADNWGYGGIRLGEYELYISNSKDSLYDADNLVAHVVPDKSATNNDSTVVDLISLKEARKAGYFGIKIIDENLSDIVEGIRMHEIGVYGTPLSESKDKVNSLLNSSSNGLLNSDGKNDASLGKIVKTEKDSTAYNGGLNKVTFDAINKIYYDKNLLSGKIAEINVEEGYEFYSPDGSVDRLTDEIIDSASTYSIQVKNNSNNTVVFDESNVFLTYDLGKKSNLELLTVGGYRADNYQPQKYKIYVSYDKDSLYSAENLIAVYDYRDISLTNGAALPVTPYAIASGDGTGAIPLIAQYFDMSGVSGRYIGIRIMGDKDRIAIGEIALWAQKDIYMPELDNYYLYSEEIFNLIDNGDFEDVVSKDNWGTFGNGISVKKDKQNVASHGENYLSVSNDALHTIKINVKSDTEYTIAFNALLGSSDSAKIKLAYDENGTQFEDIIKGSVKGSVTDGVINLTDTYGKWTRFGYSFSSGEHTEVYLTVYGTSGTLLVDDFYLFRSDRGYSSDPNDYVITSPIYIGNVEVVDLDNLPVEEDSDFDDVLDSDDSDDDSDSTLEEDISGDDDNKESNSDLDSSDSEKDNNGKVIWLIIIITLVVAAITVAVILVLKRRGGKSK